MDAVHRQDRHTTEDRIVLQRHLDIEGKPSQLALIIGYLNSMHSTEATPWMMPSSVR